MCNTIKSASLILLGALVSTDAFAEQSIPYLDSANPGLMAFVNSAVNESPQVIAAQASIESARSREVAAGKPLFNPEIGFDADNGEVQERVFNLSQTIDWSNQREARSLIAASDTGAAIAGYQLVQQQVASELLIGLSAYQTSKAREALTRQRVSIMNDFSSLSKKRFEQGDLNRVELSIASLAYVEARIRHADLQVEMADAIALVENIAPGVSPDNWPALNSLQPLPGYNNVQLTTNLPGVVSAQNFAAAALATIELRKREKKPGPSLSLRGGTEGDDSLIGFGVTIPLYLRNNYQAEVDVAAHDYRAAQQFYDDTYRRSLSKLANSSLRYTLYYEAWQDWQSTGLLDLNNQAEQLQQLYEAGELSTTEFLLQIQQTLDTRESALILHQNTWAAWLDWLASSGKIADWLKLETSE